MNTNPNFADGSVAGLAVAVLMQAFKENPRWFWDQPEAALFWLELTDIPPDTFYRRLRRKVPYEATN